MEIGAVGLLKFSEIGHRILWFEFLSPLPFPFGPLPNKAPSTVGLALMVYLVHLP